MRRAWLMNQFHITVTAAANSKPAQLRQMRRVVNSARFRRQLAHAVDQVQKQFAALRRARITVE